MRLRLIHRGWWVQEHTGREAVSLLLRILSNPNYRIVRWSIGGTNRNHIDILLLRLSEKYLVILCIDFCYHSLNHQFEIYEMEIKVYEIMGGGGGD